MTHFPDNSLYAMAWDVVNYCKIVMWNWEQVLLLAVLLR